MPHPFRKSLVAVAVLAGTVGLAGAEFPSGSAFASTPGPTTTSLLGNATVNTAVSVNRQDGHSVFHLSFHIDRPTGEAVDVSNLAVAVSECSDCQTVAISFDIELISPVPAELTATDTSIAVNSDCVVCDTLAAAFQFVVATPTPVELTRTGRREVHHIEEALEGLGDSGESTAQMAPEIQTLAAELSEVLSTQLVPVTHDRGPDDDQVAHHDRVSYDDRYLHQRWGFR